MKPYLIGVDLGGTYIKTALVTLKGDIVHKIQIPSEKEKGPDGVIANIGQSIYRIMEKSGIEMDKAEAIGIGSPGPLNTKKGIVCQAINLPGWINVPLRDRIQGHFRIPTNLENDANAAAYGEYWRGAGIGSHIMLAYTLGTGVGGGIIIEGKLIRGANDSAGFLGHMTIMPEGELCNCGNNGCVESYASATSLVRRTREKLNKGAESILNQWLIEGKTLTAKLIYEARKEGDQFAEEALREVGYYLGIGVSNSVSVLNPDVVVLGGGMMKAGDIILEPVRREVKRRVFPELLESLKIVTARLGNDAGVIGAAGLVLERKGIHQTFSSSDVSS